MVARKHAVLAMMLLWLASSVQQSAARRSAQSASLSVAMRRGGACSGCSTPAGSSTEVSSTGRNTGAYGERGGENDHVENINRHFHTQMSTKGEAGLNTPVLHHRRAPLG